MWWLSRIIHPQSYSQTHTDTLETRDWADNEEDLTFHWDVMFISLSLPPKIPPDHNSLCPDKPREAERKTERPSEENGEVKKEGTTHRPHNGCGISYIANTHAGRETWVWLWCVWSPLGGCNQWQNITKDMHFKKIEIVKNVKTLKKRIHDFLQPLITVTS